MSDLRDQTEPDGILRELARTCWAKAHEAGEAWAQASAEPTRYPSPADMAAWTADGATEAARAEAAERLTALVPPDWQDARGRGAGARIGPTYPLGEYPAPGSGRVHVVPDRVDLAEAQRYMLVTGLTRPSMATVAAPSLSLYGRLVSDAHRRWPGGPHPLATLVADWLQFAPVPVEPDERRYQNIPAPFVGTRHVILHRQDDHPNLPFADADLAQPLPPADEARFETAYLVPEWEPAPSMLPRGLLDLFDFGASRGRNGPVPVPARTGWEMVLFPKPGDWHADQATATPKIGTLAARVWPTTDYRATKHGPLLYTSARALNDPDNATWFRRNARSRPILVVTFFAPPVAPYHSDETIGAHIVLPDGGRRRGAQYDAPLRRVLAATSYRQHRVYLAAVCLWDRHATWGGHLVQLTQPVVVRDPGGYVIAPEGTIATEKDGRASRRATHPLAVHTGEREMNPAAADAYPWLEGHDVILAAHHRVADTHRLRNEQRRLTLETLLALRDRGTRRPRGKEIVTRAAVLDFEARYRTDGVLTGADLADLAEHKKRPPGAELEAVRVLPTLAHFAAHQQRREERKKRRLRRA